MLSLPSSEEQSVGSQQFCLLPEHSSLPPAPAAQANPTERKTAPRCRQYKATEYVLVWISSSDTTEFCDRPEAPKGWPRVNIPKNWIYFAVNASQWILMLERQELRYWLSILWNICLIPLHCSLGFIVYWKFCCKHLYTDKHYLFESPVAIDTELNTVNFVVILTSISTKN